NRQATKRPADAGPKSLLNALRTKHGRSVVQPWGAAEVGVLRKGKCACASGIPPSAYLSPDFGTLSAHLLGDRWATCAAQFSVTAWNCGYSLSSAALRMAVERVPARPGGPCVHSQWT